MSLKINSKSVVVAGTLPKLVQYLASEELPGNFIIIIYYALSIDGILSYRHKLHQNVYSYIPSIPVFS